MDCISVSLESHTTGP